MTKNDLKKIMERHCIVDCELIDVIRFVHDLIFQKAKILKETEPYATKTIEKLLEAALEVYDLEYDVDEIMKGSYE